MMSEPRRLTKPPRIAIVGAGIGGLSSAAFLHRAGMNVTVFEQSPLIGEVGAGIVVSPNAVRLIRRLGNFDDFAINAVELETGWEFRRWENGDVLFSQRLGADCRERYGEGTFTAHRADLLAAIQAAVPPEFVMLGKQCVRLEQRDGGVRLFFADGSTADADVVIGADGVHSVIRRALFGESAAEPSGMCAFRAVIPAASAPAFALEPVQSLWLGPDHHLVHYPISGGSAINLVAFAPSRDFSTESWSAMSTTSEFLSEFESWDPRVLELIVAAPPPGKWALLDRAPLPSWTQDNVCLMGDAAHPMFPFFAQGSAQAIEDAAVLAVCLADCPDLPALALANYERLRRTRANEVQDASHRRKDINHLPDGPVQRERDGTLADQNPLEHNAWLYGFDAEHSAHAALAS